MFPANLVQATFQQVSEDPGIPARDSAPSNYLRLADLKKTNSSTYQTWADPHI